MRRREILARQPSYCKILNDLKEVESSESEEQELAGETTETKQEKAEVGFRVYFKLRKIKNVFVFSLVHLVSFEWGHYKIKCCGPSKVC